MPQVKLYKEYKTYGTSFNHSHLGLGGSIENLKFFY
jgi:hypothetical protein